MALVLSHYRLALQSARSTISSNAEVLSEYANVELSGEGYTKVLKFIDNIFVQAIGKCFSTFCEINEPIVSRDEVLSMIECYCDNLPEHYKMMRKLMQMGGKENLQRNEHLVNKNFYKKLIFYQFLSQSRVMNTQTLTGWASATTIANYARGITVYKQSSQTYFGSSISHRTMNRTLDRYKTKNHESLLQLLSPRKIILATMDNNQKGYNVKNPRGGVNNQFIKVTGRTFVECEETYMNGIEDVHVAITYTNQVIPSVLNQPHFEQLVGENGILDTQIIGAISDFKSIGNTGMPIDITGKRVQTYIDIVDICHTISCENHYLSGYNWMTGEFKRWNHQPQTYYDNPTRKSTVKIMSRLKKSFIPAAKSFQRRHTRIWNKRSGISTKILIPVVSTYDEMKLNEYGMAVVQLMKLCGLLVKHSKKCIR